MENGDGDHYREQMLRAHSVPYSEIREKKCNFEKIHCLRFKNLKLVFFDQNMNRLELEGHGRDELRNNFENQGYLGRVFIPGDRSSFFENIQRQNFHSYLHFM